LTPSQLLLLVTDNLLHGTSPLISMSILQT